MEIERSIQAATDTYLFRLFDNSEDILDEACAETWRGGQEEWWSQGMVPAAAEDHCERIFCAITAKLAVALAARATHPMTGSLLPRNDDDAITTG